MRLQWVGAGDVRGYVMSMGAKHTHDQPNTLTYTHSWVVQQGKDKYKILSGMRQRHQVAAMLPW